MSVSPRPLVGFGATFLITAMVGGRRDEGAGRKGYVACGGWMPGCPRAG